MAVQTVVIDIVANFRNNTSSGINSAKQSVDKFLSATQKAKREMDRLGGTNARPRISVMDRASSTIRKVDSSLKAIGGKTVRAGVKILDYATTPLRRIKDSLFSIKGLVAAIGTGMVANQVLMKPISLADSYTSAKIGFSNLLGESGGQKMMNDLDAFAKATPFKTSGVIDNAQKMMAMGWSADTLLEDMKTIGDAAAATGKMDQGLESIVRALAQIKTKGKLSTEELNQLSEAGIAAKAMLAEQLGYGTGDKGIAAMTKDLEDGLIGSETAIQALLHGMKQFDGTMEKTANETVEGLKSQLEDTFEINIARKWGQGLQDGAKRGLGSILELLDRSEGSLEKFGDTVYEIGKELSNWAADKLEGTIDKILEVSESEEFKNASFGGKMKIMWDEVIAKPFGEWWDSKGKAFMADKLSTFGEGLGSGMSKGLMALLGIDVVGATGEAASLGGSFASGFAKGFEGKKVWDAIVKAAGRAFKSGFTSLFTGSAMERIIVGGLALKVTSGILGGISKAQTLWSGTGAMTGGGALTVSGMGLKGMLGATGNAMVGGSGILGSLASLGYKATGFTPTAGMYFGSTAGAMSGGTAALAGLGTAAGIVGGVAGSVNAIGDLTKAVQAQTKNDKTLFGTRAGVKAGMVGTGAAIGTIIAPGIGTAIGAGLGGLATFLAGNKLADSISGVSKSTAELNEEAEELAQKDMAKRFGDISLSADQLSEKVQEVFGEKTISRVNKFNQSMADLESVRGTLSDFTDDLNYTHERIMGKETLSEADIETYKSSLKDYASTVKQLLSANKESSKSAFQLLYGDDTKGLQSATKTMNKTYTKLEKQLSERSSKLNDVIAKSFEDGKITIDEEKKINEVVNQIKKIQDKIEERLKKEEEAQRDASYDLIGMKYKNTDLTSESFKELISELDAQSKTDQQAYDDAFIKAKAELDLELELGEIKKDKYNKKLAELEGKWLEGKSISVKQGVEVSLEVLKTNYGEEFKGLQERLAKGNIFNDGELFTLKNSTKETGLRGDSKGYTWNKNSKIEFAALQDSFLESAGVSEKVQKQMKEMYDSLKPQESDLQELKKSYEDAGKEIPKWIEDSLAEIENVKLMSGDMDSFYKLIGEQIAGEDKAYAEQLLKNAGEDLPKALKEGIEAGLANTKVDGKVKGNVEVDANVKTDKAKEKTESETKGALGKNQTVNKTAIVPVASKTTGTQQAAEKAFQETKSPLDQRFGTTISEKSRVKIETVSLSGASEAISSAWEKFKGWVKSKFSNSISTTTSVQNTINNGGNSKLGNRRKFSTGGYVDKAVRALVGEAGPEMIIPLSANRRQRGKALWEQAGRAMGLWDGAIPNANGGLYGVGSSKLGNLMNRASSGNNTVVTQKASGNGTVKVEVGGVTIKIESTGQGVQNDIQQNADAIAGQIAEILQRAFQNMPLTVEV